MIHIRILTDFPSSWIGLQIVRMNFLSKAGIVFLSALVAFKILKCIAQSNGLKMCRFSFYICLWNFLELGPVYVDISNGRGSVLGSNKLLNSFKLYSLR